MLTWAITKEKEFNSPILIRDVSIILGTIFVIATLRYFPDLCCLSSKPPQFQQVLPILVAFTAVAFLFFRIKNNSWLRVWSLIPILLLIYLKNDSLSTTLAMSLRSITGQDPTLAAVSEIQWIGFSYISFRLLSTIYDRIDGRLPELSLGDFVTYAIFFPALAAGPIERVERFTTQLTKTEPINNQQFLDASKRLIKGLFIKFVLADSLAIISLNPTLSEQVTQSGWMWFFLYAYTFRIYFDFSGYTDIAIGIGQFAGVQLSENFSKPYSRPNITEFWNSWHITLAQWFRSYYFNPLTRSLRKNKVSIPVVIFLAQTSNMLLIGLWHGITWNFAIWGLWHGVGLFIHNRWNNYKKQRAISFDTPLYKALGTVITFHFVALGWVWFVLPGTELATNVFRILFGGS